MSGIILASGSKTRQATLKQAGVEFHVEVSHVDEDQVKASAQEHEATAQSLAETLAELKAQRVSIRYPEAIVLGCDQTLDCQGKLFDKPKDMANAHGHLMAFSGKTHSLWSSVVAIRGGERLWHFNDEAQLTMRPLNQDFIAWYLNQTGESVLSSVGAYQLEGLGAQLFSKIDGNYFTILGLPLLAVLDFLRNQGAIPR